MAGSIGNARSVVRVGKRTRLTRLTRKQIERLLALGRNTWMKVNETLTRSGKWNHKKEEE